ncbi:hypothetical protein OG883_45510 [Streptomyces sp. NBC_01142]|uniref:hypothetical protein n=1 Tax=Streptomyces sp. NBC_01142 TaxID=2975865 RepID=UPI002252356A|nr:hypothetical protein [Streptomyces sp. NBC_01142]MCX4826898.1 hypothetical protein [Streptomyces sp. NBC_01142]
MSQPAILDFTAGSLARHLARHDMPGQRSKTAITQLRRRRAALNPALAPVPPVKERAKARFLADAVAEIVRRGGETHIEGENRATPLLVVERTDEIALIRASGWRWYGKRVKPRYVDLAYLYGKDDASPWAVRVSGTVTSVAEGLTWLTPAAVVKAEAAGRRVRRQGDVYAIETTARRDGRGVLPEAHEWRPATRRMVHRPADGRRHRPLTLPWPVEFVTQRTIAMGRSNGWAEGD